LARTANRWNPWLRPDHVCGDAHGDQSHQAESFRHSKCEPASFEMYARLTDVALTAEPSGGWVVSVVFGGVVSAFVTVNVATAGGSLPSAR
jgi:hypothetical protein